MADDSKAPSELSYADFAKAAQERPEQFETGIDAIRKVDSGLGGGYRAAIGAAQTANSPMEVVDAAKAGFLNPEQAASWQQIAQRAGMDNKYGQLAAAGLGALTEPTLLRVPGLNMAAKEYKEAKALAPTLENLNAEGKILIKGTPSLNAISKEFKGGKTLAPTLENLNAEGKIFIKGAPETAGQAARIGAQLKQEMGAAQAASREGAMNQTIDFATHKTRQAAKDYAVQAVKAELAAQPAVGRDPNYLKTRINDLFNFYMQQRK